MRDRVLLRSLILVVVVMLLAAACSDDTSKEGPITIVGQVDFNVQPIVGTFEVAEGADVLQCSDGTFEDEFVSEGNIVRVFTCDSGSNEGTFTAAFTIAESEPGARFDDGTWSVVEGSNDFVGLQGSGEWSVVYSDPDEPKGVDTWTGDINYTS
jgi:hypothetical protein